MSKALLKEFWITDRASWGALTGALQGTPFRPETIIRLEGGPRILVTDAPLKALRQVCRRYGVRLPREYVIVATNEVDG